MSTKRTTIALTAAMLLWSATAFAQPESTLNKCQQTAAKEIGKYGAAVQKTAGKCLNKISTARIKHALGDAGDAASACASALLEMAEAYPQSRFHGYDISKHALVRAEENRNAAGVSSVSFHDAGVDPMPGDGDFDLLTSSTRFKKHDFDNPVNAYYEIRP